MTAVALVACFGALAGGEQAAAAPPTVTEFSAGLTAGAQPNGIAAGPDGNLWFTELNGNRIGRITPNGTITEFSAGITAGAGPFEIAAGPDGNMWFTERFGNRIGRITPNGTITEFSAGLSPGAEPGGIAAGRDGAMWFTELNGNRIGRIDPAGAIVEFSAGMTAGAHPFGIATGPDGNLWFAEELGNRIGRISIAGTITEFSAGITAGAAPALIAAGPDGNLWFAEFGGNRIGRINPTTGTSTEFSTGLTAGAGLVSITAGPDGNLWFTESNSNRIGRITPGGTITEYSTGLTAGAGPRVITVGPDGNLWFTETNGNRIGRINTRIEPPAFSNTAQIMIPAAGTAGPAAPYPSTIAVAGRGGTVTDVRVRLNGVFHTFPADIEFLLVGPQGQKVTLIAHPTTAFTGSNDATGAVINLADDGATPLGQLVSGRFEPRTFAAAPTFPAPAPAGPYERTLGAFDGTQPNGNWHLYVNDDNGGDVGRLAAGWSLDVDTTGGPPPGGGGDPPPGGGESDTSPPETVKGKGPKKRTTRTKAQFAFSSEDGATFECALDTKTPFACTSPATVKKLKPRRHTFRVTAIDAAGNRDPEPAAWRFKVVRKR